MSYLWYIPLAIIPFVIYAVVVMLVVPGASEERLGKGRSLPPDLGQWKPDRDSEAGQSAQRDGLVREQRLWLDETGGFLGRGRLVQQTRYIDPTTGEIERTEPDRRVSRRAIKADDPARRAPAS